MEESLSENHTGQTRNVRRADGIACAEADAGGTGSGMTVQRYTEIISAKDIGGFLKDVINGCLR